MDKIYVRIVFLFLFIECFLVNQSDACTAWGHGFDSGESCVVDLECRDDSLIVLFREPDFPMIQNISTAFCEVNDTHKIYFEQDGAGNWTTSSIDNDLARESFDNESRQVISITCYIYYAGENVDFHKDENFTLECTHDIISVSLEFNVTKNVTSEKEKSIGTFSSIKTNDDNATLSICGEATASQNCTSNTEVTVGEKVCLGMGVEKEGTDIQIVKMTFSSGANELDVYKGCSRSSDPLVDSIFDPEPPYTEACNETGVKSCAGFKMLCFKVFRFKDSYTMKFELFLRTTAETNSKRSCITRRKRDINSNEDDDDQEEKDIMMSFFLTFNEDDEMDTNEIIQAYREEIEYPLTKEVFIGMLVASGLFIMIIVLVLYIFKCRTVKIAGLDDPKVVA